MNEKLLKFIAVLILYGLVFFISEFFYRKKISSRITRKINHIGNGMVSFFLPYFVSFGVALSIGFAFVLLLFWSKKRKILASIHDGDNDSLGAVFFPLGLIVSGMVFWRINPLIFQTSVLVLGFSDGLSGLLGQKFQIGLYNISGKKTLIGSLAFWFCTVAIFSILLLLFHINLNLITAVKIVFGALLLTAIEGFLGNGWDNLIIPLATGSIFYWFFL